MPLDVLKDCKKCIIQKINNPGSYWVMENENEAYNKKKIRRFERLLAEDVVRCRSGQKVRIGQMVAIKDEKGFHRGKVADIFKRSCKTMYWVLLIDSGKTIETEEENIYMIKNQEFKDKTANAFEITIHGVQPATLDINYDNPTAGEIFQRRKCKKWSEGAYRFVTKLFKEDPCIFVKIISCDKKASSEIYYIQDSKVISLGQSLCDKGFAILCDAAEKSKDDFSKEIEEKIPANALFDDLKPGKPLKNLSVHVGSITDDVKTVSLPQKSVLMAQRTKKDSLSSLTKKTENASSFDSSAISASNKSQVNTKPFYESDKTLNKEDDNEMVKLNVCKIVLRNLRLFNQQKHITEERNHN